MHSDFSLKTDLEWEENTHKERKCSFLPLDATNNILLVLFVVVELSLLSKTFNRLSILFHETNTFCYYGTYY